MIQPIRENILFKPFPGDNISEGGIFLPDSVQTLSNKGTVVAVGTGTKKNPMKLKPGDIGIRVKDYGEEIIIDGDKHYLMNQNAILALQ